MSRRSKSSIIFEPVNSTDPCKTVVQSNLNVKKDATLKCDLDVKKCLNVKNVVYCEENIDETCQNISSDISLTWVNTNGEGYLEEGKKDGMYKKIVKTVTGDSTEGWTSIGFYPGNFFNSSVRSIALDPNDEKNIYIGGAFTVQYPFIAKWDGSSWTSVGIPGYFNNRINKITFNPVTGEGPYVGGSFTQVGGDSNLNYLVKWDGSGWTSVKPGGDGITGLGIINPFIEDILFTPGGSGPYISGYFFGIGGQTTTNIAYFNGIDWEIHNIGNINPYAKMAYGTIDGVPNRLIVANQATFTFSGGLTAYGLPVYDFPLSILGIVETKARTYSISLSPSNILHIGTYAIPGEYIDGITGLYLAKYDEQTQSWTSVSGQTGEFNNWIYNISFEKNCENPYVGGRFTQVGGNPNLNFLTKWNGYKWESIDNNGIDTILQPPNIASTIYDIQFTSDNKTTYIGGFFYDLGLSYWMISQYTRESYRITYNKGSESELLINEDDCVSFIYNEDLEEWIKLN